jgi:Ca2+-binding EF-hand superfamily protein
MNRNIFIYTYLYIELSELALLLEDLGVEATEERLREAFAVFDMNRDGVISFQEFGLWWRRYIY